MPLARVLSIIVVLLTAGSCVSRADVAVTTIDERTAPLQPTIRANPEQDFDNILHGGADIASFAVVVTARARATSAILHTEFTSREPSRPTAPDAQVTIADAAPIIAALLKSGISQRAITTSQRVSAPNHQTAIPGAVDITVALQNADPDYIRSLGKVIDEAKGYPVYHAFSDVTFRVDDCTQLLAQARRAALDEARAQAARAVPGPHPRLGPLVSVREIGLTITEGSCGDMSPMGASTPVYRNGDFERANGGYVVATSRLSVGFQLLP